MLAPACNQGAAVGVERDEALAEKAILFRLDLAIQLADHVRGEAAEEPHDGALLDGELRAPRKHRHRADAVADGETHRRAVSLEGSVQRRSKERLREERQIPFRLTPGD